MSDALQRSLFEDDYLLRSLGAIATDPQTAISELVANAWDAGAFNVRISVPDELGGTLSIADDGVGLSPDQFTSRWMKLGYKRTHHQGEWADFPPERSSWKRRAYGRNGQGRHGLLCFSSSYWVETLPYSADESTDDNDTAAWKYEVKPTSGDTPFLLLSAVPGSLSKHGTMVSAVVERNLPSLETVVDALSMTFLHDPQFHITVNDQPIRIETFQVIDEKTLDVEGASVTVTFREIPATRHRKASHGVAFWVGKRLVGQPEYSLLGTPLIDGRSSIANRHLIVVQSDDLYNDVRPDWTGFRRSSRIELLGAEVQRHLTSVISRLNVVAIEETKQEALRSNSAEIRKLTPLAKLEVTEFVESLMEDSPTLNVDILTVAVRAAVNLEKSRSGRHLLAKLATISEVDADLLNSVLENWTLRDALAVLDEIDRRVSVVKALEKLTGDKAADELHTVHPLVSHARWLFGPEFDSPLFASNITIQTAANLVFKKKIDRRGISNPRQRPDLIFLKDATVSLTGTEKFVGDNDVAKLERLLLIELKRGDSTITLSHKNQAEQYVQDLLNCKVLDGSPFIHAFVVGHRVDERVTQTTLGEPSSPIARIEPCTFGQLVRTADRRLFTLNSLVSERYKDVPGLELVKKVLGEHRQLPLFDGSGTQLSGSRKATRRHNP